MAHFYFHTCGEIFETVLDQNIQKICFALCLASLAIVWSDWSGLAKETFSEVQ